MLITYFFHLLKLKTFSGLYWNWKIFCFSDSCHICHVSERINSTWVEKIWSVLRNQEKTKFFSNNLCGVCAKPQLRPIAYDTYLIIFWKICVSLSGPHHSLHAFLWNWIEAIFHAVSVKDQGFEPPTHWSWTFF